VVAKVSDVQQNVNTRLFVYDTRAVCDDIPETAEEAEGAQNHA
jgi:hypothetical protein